jgi:hypothetical protein
MVIGVLFPPLQSPVNIALRIIKGAKNKTSDAPATAAVRRDGFLAHPVAIRASRIVRQVNAHRIPAYRSQYDIPAITAAPTQEIPFRAPALVSPVLARNRRLARPKMVKMASLRAETEEPIAKLFTSQQTTATRAAQRDGSSIRMRHHNPPAVSAKHAVEINRAALS